MVLDLFSRQVVGWSMKSQLISDLAIDALLMAVWRRKPNREVMVQSDQGSQYRSSDWRSLLKANRLVGSMSRRGNCHNNAVAEIFSRCSNGNESREKSTPLGKMLMGMYSITSRCFTTQYDSKRRHSFNEQLSPVEFEKRNTGSLESV